MPSNYPPGAEHDPNAPYNEVSIPEKEFCVTCSQSLSRSTPILTDDYIPEYDDETGHVYTDTSQTDWNKAYGDAAMTPLEIICAAEKIAKALIEEGKMRVGGVYLKGLVEECEGWNDDETTIVED